MIRILNSDNEYRREQEFSELTFNRCTKILSKTTLGALLQSYCIAAVMRGSAEISVNKNRPVTLDEGSVALTSPNMLLQASTLSEDSELLLVFFECDNFIFFNIKANGFRYFKIITFFLRERYYWKKQQYKK